MTVAADSNISTIGESITPLMELFHADALAHSESHDHDALLCAPSSGQTAATDAERAQDHIAGRAARVPAMDRLERTRQINREAQARYRNRLKQEAEDLEAKVTHTKLSLDRQRIKLIQLGKRSSSAHKRICSATAALLQLSQSKGLKQGGSPHALDGNGRVGTLPPAYAARAGAEPPSPNHDRAAAAAAGYVPVVSESSSPAGCQTRSPSMPPCPPLATVPPPLPPLSPAPAAHPPQQLYAPLTIESVFAQLPAADAAATMPPLANTPAWHAAAAQGTLAACSTAGALATAQRAVGSCAAIVQSQREAFASAANVSAGHVAWSLHTPYHVALGTVMSLSSTVATVPCCASLYIFYFASRLEGSFLAAALDPVSTDTPEPPEEELQCVADRALRKVDQVLSTFQDVQTTLNASCNTGGHFPVAAGTTKLVTAVCTRFRKLLPRHIWLRACALFVGLLVPPPGDPAAAARHTCTISSALSNSRSTQAGHAVRQQPHIASQCPKCAVVPHFAAVLRQQLTQVLEAATSEPPPQQLSAEEEQRLVQRTACIFGCGALALGQCMRDAPRVFRHLHSFSPGIAPDRRFLAAELFTTALYSKMRLEPAQRALAAAVWQLWQKQRQALDVRLRSALGVLGRLLHSTDLRAPSVSDLETLLHKLEGGAAPMPRPRLCRFGSSIGSGTGEEADPPMKVCRVDPPTTEMLPAHEPKGLEKYLGSMDCAACCAAVRLHGVPCGECAGRIAGKLAGASAHTTMLACAALCQLADLQQRDADEFVAVVTAVAMPGVVFSARQIAMHVPLVFEHGLPLVDWLQLCAAAARQLQHEELLGVFADGRLGDSMPLVLHRASSGTGSGSDGTDGEPSSPGLTGAAPAPQGVVAR
eukprot:jgi/Ulvmu1/6391/UM003_0019.1